MMQRPNYWPRSSYNPRDGSWVQSWYGASYCENNSVRNEYESAFFHKNHVQHTDSEYFTPPDVQIIAEKRGSTSFSSSGSTGVHNSTLSESVSPNASFSESSFRVTPPRHHFVNVPPSPQSHCVVDVSSPVSYHSDEASPRLSQSSPTRSQQYYDTAPSLSSYNDYGSSSSSPRMLSSSRVNSHTKQFYKLHKELHLNEASQGVEPTIHSRSYTGSSRNDRTFNNSASFKTFDSKGGWSAHRHHRQPFPPKKNSFAGINHVSYSSKPQPHKQRPLDTDKQKEDPSVVLSPAQPNNVIKSSSPVKYDKSSTGVAKSSVSAPPVEKSITNLISKLFHQNVTNNSVPNCHAQEKSLKSNDNSPASSVVEIKLKKSKVLPSTEAANRERNKVPSRIRSKSQQNPVNAAVSQNKAGICSKNSLPKDCAILPTKVLSNTTEHAKKNSVSKPSLKNLQHRNLVRKLQEQSSSSGSDSEIRDKQGTFEGTVPPNDVSSDVAFAGKKLPEFENKKKEVTSPVKKLRARISIGSGNNVLGKDPCPASPQSPGKSIPSNLEANLGERFNGSLIPNAMAVSDSMQCLKPPSGKTLKARKTGWENRSRAIKTSQDKLLCNSDVETQDDDFEPKARKSFRPQLQGSSLPLVTDQVEFDRKISTGKKKKRRHFRGGRYDLSRRPKKKKEKKSADRKKSVDDDSSETSEMADDILFFDNSNSEDLSSVNSNSESLPPAKKGDFSELQDLHKSFENIGSVLKLPLKEVLWTNFGKAKNFDDEGTATVHENNIEIRNSSLKDTHASKSTKTSSVLECAKMTLDKQFCGVARKSQVPYRQLSGIQNSDSNCVKLSTECTNSKNSKTKQNKLIPDSPAIEEGKPESSNYDSDIEIVGFVGKISGNALLPSTAVSATQGEKTDKENSFLDGKSLPSLAGFSSDSDDEVLIKKRKRGSNEILHIGENAWNGERKLLVLSNGRTESLYTKDMKLPKSLCTCLARSLCDSNTQFPEEMLICQAVDTIDGELVSCKNRLAKSNLVRPSLKIPYVAMCESHLARLRLHQCCPNCGFFCTQGVFLQCITMDPRTKELNYHFLHRVCQSPVTNEGPPQCPHCGNFEKFKTATLKLNAAPNAPLLSAESKESEPEVTEDCDKNCISDLNNTNIDVSDSDVMSGNKPPSIPDELQLKSMADSLASEKSISLRPSGKSFYAPVKSGDMDKVLLLLVMGVDPNHRFEHHNNDTPLHVAAETGFPLLVHILIQAGACINLVNNNLYTPMMLAVEKKHISVVQCLIMAGAQQSMKSEEGMTCLHLAACGGNVFLCKMVLESKYLKINIQDDGGWTPLVWAAEHKHLAITKLLLEKGADPNVMDKEKNIALHWAAFSGCTEVAQLLLDWGCSLDSVNEHGDTPLHIAAREDNYECVVLFLARGASTSLKNYENGQTPMLCCKSSSCPSWMALQLHSKLQKWKEGKVKNERVVSTDISRGKEDEPIQVVNGVDDEKAPSDFHYVTTSCETSDISINTNVLFLQSCTCNDNCTSQDCACSVMSFQCWYDKNGCLLPQFDIAEPPLIFECNRLCYCCKRCRNRVVQRGTTCRLQVFRTKGKGWGVRTLKSISKGTFICEYVGEVITDLDADHRDDDSYLFDLDNRDSDTYCLDARYYGNVSRFINHLCDANLVPVKVFVDHQDLKFPRIAFFSTRDIKAFEELGFDYGERFWSIKSKWFFCDCGSPQCKYSREKIQSSEKLNPPDSETSVPS